MIDPLRGSIPDVRSNHLLVAGFTSAALLLALYSGFHFHLLVLVLFAALVLLALRLPLTTCVLLLLTGVIPSVFLEIPGFPEEYGLLGWGVRAVDIVLVAMVGAAVIHVTTHGVGNKGLGLSSLLIAFGIWLSFEVARNVMTFGLSAFGEFRFRYLIVILPVYVGMFFRSSKDRRLLLIVLIVASLIIPVLSVPLIGSLKGWSFGVDSRFFHASVSLGIVAGFLSLVLARRYKLVRFPGAFYWPISVLAILMVLVDGHRSVWLFTAVCFLTLLVWREVPWRPVLGFVIALIALSGVLIVFSSSSLVADFFDYVVQRNQAFLDPQLDPTARWRIGIWYTLLETIIQSPMLGEGFGGYWFIIVPGIGEITSSPHSLYIQTLVKIGAIGLVLYMAIVVKVFSILKRALRRVEAMKGDSVLVFIGLMVLLSAHAYYFVYAFEYYSCFFVGLGMAAVSGRHSRMDQ